MLTEAIFRQNKLHDITHWGIRTAIGSIFIVHSLKKFDPSWQDWLVSIGLPPEMQLLIALAEFIGGDNSINLFYNFTWCNFSHKMGKWILCIRRRLGMGSNYAGCSTFNNCCGSWKSFRLSPC
jgi:hypothetical protein